MELLYLALICCSNSLSKFKKLKKNYEYDLTIENLNKISQLSNHVLNTLELNNVLE